MKRAVILIFVVLGAQTVLSYTFPNAFERCHLNDRELDRCLKSAIQNAIYLIGDTGIPSLNLPSIDPLEFGSMVLAAGDRSVNLVQRYSDVKLTGLSRATVERAHLDTNRNVLSFTLRIPKIEQKAKYEMDGNILGKRIFGAGDSVFTMIDTTEVHTIKFSEDMTSNGYHFTVTSYDFSLKPRKLQFSFNDLYGGDHRMAAEILEAMNDHWEEIYDEIGEGIESVYADVFKHIANELLREVPYYEIFLK